MSDAYQQLRIDSIEQWRAWLDEHHDSSPGVWLVTAKKDHEHYVAYADLVDEAICFGWVDSQPRSVDAHHSSRLMTPRRPGSKWSRVNKDRVARLTKAGRMAPAGLTIVHTARQDGSWNALDQVEDLHEPADLANALDGDEGVRHNWDGFPRSAKRAILEWLANARTAATRSKRIEQIVVEAIEKPARQPMAATQGRLLKMAGTQHALTSGSAADNARDSTTLGRLRQRAAPVRACSELLRREVTQRDESAECAHDLVGGRGNEPP